MGISDEIDDANDDLRHQSDDLTKKIFSEIIV